MKLLDLIDRCWAEVAAARENLDRAAVALAAARSVAELEPRTIEALPAPVPVVDALRAIPVTCSRCRAEMTSDVMAAHWRVCRAPLVDDERAPAARAVAS